MENGDSRKRKLKGMDVEVEWSVPAEDDSMRTEPDRMLGGVGAHMP
jgi:hypothetical protein